MTNADVLSRILAEATGKPLDQVKPLLNAFTAIAGSRGRLDAQLSDRDSKALLTKLRAELPAIRAWITIAQRQARNADFMTHALAV